jgi:hypothetical protein
MGGSKGTVRCRRDGFIDACQILEPAYESQFPCAVCTHLLSRYSHRRNIICRAPPWRFADLRPMRIQPCGGPLPISESWICGAMNDWHPSRSAPTIRPRLHCRDHYGGQRRGQHTMLSTCAVRTGLGISRRFSAGYGPMEWDGDRPCNQTRLSACGFTSPLPDRRS